MTRGRGPTPDLFLQNAVNLGLKMVTAPEIEASEGDEPVVEKDAVVNQTTGKRYAVEPLSPARQAIIDAGGLIAYTRQIVLKERAAVHAQKTPATRPVAGSSGLVP